MEKSTHDYTLGAHITEDQVFYAIDGDGNGLCIVGEPSDLPAGMQTVISLRSARQIVGALEDLLAQQTEDFLDTAEENMNILYGNGPLPSQTKH